MVRPNPRPPAGPAASPFVRVVESSAAQRRLEEARSFVEARLPHGDVLICRRLTWCPDASSPKPSPPCSGATIGLHRFSLYTAGCSASPLLFLAAEGDLLP